MGNVIDVVLMIKPTAVNMVWWFMIFPLALTAQMKAWKDYCDWEFKQRMKRGDKS